MALYSVPRLMPCCAQMASTFTPLAYSARASSILLISSGGRPRRSAIVRELGELAAIPAGHGGIDGETVSRPRRTRQRAQLGDGFDFERLHLFVSRQVERRACGIGEVQRERQEGRSLDGAVGRASLTEVGDIEYLEIARLRHRGVDEAIHLRNVTVGR